MRSIIDGGGARSLALVAALVVAPPLAAQGSAPDSAGTGAPAAALPTVRVTATREGARSAFGVRGVRVLQDGIPLTLPDGQTPVDVVDIEGAERVEVVRGSASSLYGNAAGGVIDVRSTPPPLVGLAPYARIVGGDRVPTISAAGAGGTLGPIGYTSSVTRVVGRGYRDYSDQRATRAALRLVRPHAEGSAIPGITLAARLSDVDLAES